MSTQSEATLENSLIKRLVDNGYEKVTIKDETDLKKNFKSQLERFNGISLSDDDFNKILIHLENGSVYEKAKKLRDKFELERDGKIIYISFFDSKHWCQNLFQVAHQITFKGSYENRYDVTLLINGLPLVQIELKKRGEPLKVAFEQINRYKHHSYHGLFDYIQIFVISNGVDTKYFSNNNNIDYDFTFFWKDKDNNNINRLEEFADTFLEKCHISKMIAKYMVFNQSKKSLMVLRAYQYYAVEAILDKALNTNSNGYVWHTTGSGKTLTSFKTAQLLCENEKIDKVMFIVDRKDLDYQTMKEFNNFSAGAVDGTDNTKSLIKQLTGNNKLIITTIQKLNNAVKSHKKQLESVKDSKMILMFDECHRSQFGDMHKNIVDFFTNIQYFGFTGTPIFSVNANNFRTTKDIFGDRLHSYLIGNAIKDHNVLGFMVEYCGKYVNKSKSDSKVQAIDTQEILESEKRLSTIVDYIIENHDSKTYDRQFTSIFAVSSIPVLKKYYNLFKSRDHNLKIAAIFSYDDNEEMDGDKHSRDSLEDMIKDYNEMFNTNFSTNSFQEYYVDVSKKSKEKQIDILLVVNMFLTGFDNKYLNTLYLDKNLQYHGLIQAFSRTNRLCGPKKKQGNIVTFRNIKEDVDDAIGLYSDENSIEYVIMHPYEYYVDKFNEFYVKLVKLVQSPDDVDNLMDENDEKKFIELFKALVHLMTRLTVFTEFKYSHLKMDEQEFMDFRSKYLDIYEKYRNHVEKTSVLDDVDFEIGLFRRDNINVAYILDLIRNMDPKSYSDKDFILRMVNSSPELKSKVELIEEFIDKNLEDLQEIDVDEAFAQFFDAKKNEAIVDLVDDEKLDYDALMDLIGEYEFTGKLKGDNIKDAFKEKLGLLDRHKKVDEVKNKIVKLIEKFTL